ncbi:uncharacterized protein LOC131598027 [Vicia villosa]|uniref:uncharacterized protein LOC131598027 n=1 Tax=Vicia villosa TaxID=3911 RepID=UPI00273C9A8E|nr:uncharacterized protein LOC131598027 [Vicia villosa]
MIIGTLNIRGGGSSAKRRRINNIISRGNPDIFFIQETKMENISVSLASSFWKKPGVEFSFFSSIGAAGGIMSLWDSNTVRVLFSFGGRGYLGLKVVWREKQYYAVNIYSPSSLAEKRILWKMLLFLKTIFLDGEWVLGGDFNAVCNRRERFGDSVLNSSKEWSEFEEFIRESEVEDVPCKGKKYTWFGGNGRSKSRIDRFLVSSNIVRDWGVVGQRVGDRDISDHFPVWLVCDKSNWGPKPFKVNKEWFSNKDFIPFVKKEWLSIKVCGRGDFILKEKLRILKEKLRWWNVNIFGKFDLEVKENVRILNEGDTEVGEDDFIETNEVLDRKRRLQRIFG